MRVWLIQTGEPLPISDGIRKMRTALLADVLIKRGHSVVWWGSAFDHGMKKFLFERDQELKINDKFTLKIIKGTGYKKNVSIGRYLDHRVVGYKFRRHAEDAPRPDIIVASVPDHETAFQAVRWASKKRIPVLVDVRDEWPDIFLDHIPAYLSLPAKLCLHHDFKITEWAFRNAYGLLSMMNYMLRWSLNKAKREATWRDRVFYLGAKPLPLTSSPSIPERFGQLPEKVRDKCVVTFVGTFGEYYNPQIIISAAKKLRQAEGNLNIFYIVAGAGKYFEPIYEKAKVLDNVFLPGWVNEQEMSYLLSISEVGIIPCTKKLNAFPNKAFSYLSAGLPIIASLDGDLRELIDRHQIGIYCPPNDVDQLARCIQKMVQDTEFRDRSARNSAAVFRNLFDATKIYGDYATHIEQVASEFYSIACS